MKWYAAHIIMYFEPKTVGEHLDEEGEFIAWENVVVFLGTSVDDVRARATERGQADERYGGDNLTWKGRSVKMVFGGVRKLVECDSEREGELGDGDEVTYSEMKIRGRDGLDKLIKGDRVEVFLDWRPEDLEGEGDITNIG